MATVKMSDARRRTYTPIVHPWRRTSRALVIPIRPGRASVGAFIFGSPARVGRRGWWRSAGGLRGEPVRRAQQRGLIRNPGGHHLDNPAPEEHDHPITGERDLGKLRCEEQDG